jgi:hypothetical protein
MAIPVTTTRPAALFGGNNCKANIPVRIILTNPASAVAVMIPDDESTGVPRITNNKIQYKEKG